MAAYRNTARGCTTGVQSRHTGLRPSASHILGVDRLLGDVRRALKYQTIAVRIDQRRDPQIVTNERRGRIQPMGPRFAKDRNGVGAHEASRYALTQQPSRPPAWRPILPVLLEHDGGMPLFKPAPASAAFGVPVSCDREPETIHIEPQ